MRADRSRLTRTLLPVVVLAGALLAGPSAASALPHPNPACVMDDADEGAGDQAHYTCRVGPLTVGGYAVEQAVDAGTPHPAVDGYITQMETDIVDANGTPVPIQRLMLHHIVFLSAGGGIDNTCTSIKGFGGESGGFSVERFFAAGEERAKMSLPPGYGYRMLAGDYWATVYMVMNHRQVSDQAYIQYKLTVEQTEALKPVEPYWLDVANCSADPIYNVPGTSRKGSTHARTSAYELPTDGRIVAGAGHVHGGARRLSVTQPRCGNRELVRSVPTWGLRSHPFYNVKPILHEPGPINMSAFSTPTGIPVDAGPGPELRLNSLYDNSRPHTRVMGIFIVYVDENLTEPINGCEARPGDIAILKTDQPGRPSPVPFTVPLTGLDENGKAIRISAPPGKLRWLKRGAKITVGDRFFSVANAIVRQGARLNWSFDSQELHNLTLANGPVGIGSPNLDGGRQFSFKFRRKGTYRFFCALHPVQMTERVVVKKLKRGRKSKGKGKRRG